MCQAMFDVWIDLHWGDVSHITVFFECFPVGFGLYSCLVFFIVWTGIWRPIYISITNKWFILSAVLSRQRHLEVHNPAKIGVCRTTLLLPGFRLSLVWIKIELSLMWEVHRRIRSCACYYCTLYLIGKTFNSILAFILAPLISRVPAVTGTQHSPQQARGRDK